MAMVNELLYKQTKNVMLYDNGAGKKVHCAPAVYRSMNVLLNIGLVSMGLNE